MTRYCPVHERGWHPGGWQNGRPPTQPSWQPLAAWKLRLALSIARAGGCAETIIVREEACDRCMEGADA